jgi:hypothetical protein
MSESGEEFPGVDEVMSSENTENEEAVSDGAVDVDKLKVSFLSTKGHIHSPSCTRKLTKPCKTQSRPSRSREVAVQRRVL